MRIARDGTHLAGFDPLLSDIDVGFRRECESGFDCQLEAVESLDPLPTAPIDYLARDYQGFRRLMLDRLAVLMPGWVEPGAASPEVTLVEMLAHVADRLAELPLVYQPGTRWSYSMSLDLMGRVIEVVSGQPFDRFLQERFFDPLGMGDTHFQVPRAKAERMTTSYFLAGSTLIPVDLGADSIYFDPPPFPFGGAGLASTPSDYDRFLEMLVNEGTFEGRRVMSAQAVRLGMSDLLPDTLVPGGEYGGVWGYGAGGRVGRGEDEGVFGWAGAAGTIGFVHRRLGLRAGLYTQYMPSMAYPLLDEFPAAIRADLAAMGRL